MGKRKIKRALFFWIDKLQISKKERVSITVLFGLIILLQLSNIVIKERLVPTPENHAAIVEEFQRRSAIIQRDSIIQANKYNPESNNEVEKQEPASLVMDSIKTLININMATQAELETLPGIGSSYATRIIEYRQTNGAFNSVDELVNVRGIGAKTLEKLKPHIKI